MSYREVLLFVAMLFSVRAVEAQYAPVAPNMRSFSSVIKGGTMPAAKEKVLYERNTGTPGVVTEQWFTGTEAMRWGYLFVNFDGSSDNNINFGHKVCQL